MHIYNHVATGRCGHRPLRRICKFPHACKKSLAPGYRTCPRREACTGISSSLLHTKPLAPGCRTCPRRKGCTGISGPLLHTKPLAPACRTCPRREACTGISSPLLHTKPLAPGCRTCPRREACTGILYEYPHAYKKASVSQSRDRGLLCGTTLVAPQCGTTRNAITGVNRPRLHICARQTSGGCSGVIFTRRGTALHRPAALWIRGGRCLSPSQR